MWTRAVVYLPPALKSTFQELTIAAWAWQRNRGAQGRELWEPAGHAWGRPGGASPAGTRTREAKGKCGGWEWGGVPVDAWQLHPPVNVTQGKSWHLEQSHELCSLQSKLSYSRLEPGPERMGLSRRNMKGLDPMIIKILPSSSLCCSHTHPALVFCAPVPPRSATKKQGFSTTLSAAGPARRSLLPKISDMPGMYASKQV